MQKVVLYVSYFLWNWVNNISKLSVLIFWTTNLFEGNPLVKSTHVCVYKFNMH